MANEITVLEGGANGVYSLLLLFPVATPAQVAGANVVPTPAAGLPETAQSILAQAEKDALDAGTALFRVIGFRPDPGLSNPQLIARVREIYAQQEAEIQSRYADRYRWVGVRIDK